MGPLGHIVISTETHRLLDPEDLRAALFEQTGVYVPTLLESIQEATGWDFLKMHVDPDHHLTRHEDRNGMIFSILTSDDSPDGRTTAIFMDHELARTFLRGDG